MPEPTITVRSPSDIAQLVPYLVGFTPEESLVLVVVDRGRIQVTARADLADLARPGEAEGLVGRIWHRFPDAEGLVVGYSAHPDAAASVAERCIAAMPAGAAIMSMTVTGDTWTTADGSHGPVDPYGPTAAAATVTGMSHRGRRSDLEALFEPAPLTDQLVDQIDTQIRQLNDPTYAASMVARTRDLIDAHLPHPAHQPLGQAAAVELALLVHQEDPQRVAVLSLTPDTAAAHLALWRDVISQVPAEIAENPLVIAGMAAWLDGDGASAAITAERAARLTDDGISRVTGRPSLVGGLEAIIDTVTPPSMWPGIRARDVANCPVPVRRAVASLTSPPAWETYTAPTGRERQPEPPTLTPPPAPGPAI